MAAEDDPVTRLPLFPLPDVVHFPRTELKLVVDEPRYLRLVRDLMEREDDEEERRIGVVLLKPGWAEHYDGRPAVHSGGTAGRLLDVEGLPDGRACILLLGELRFELERELSLDRPYRLAEVRLLEEPWLNETDAGVLAVRRSVVDLLRALADETGERFPLGLEELEELAGDLAFEELVNRTAAGLDLPPLRKQLLLQQALPERGLSLLSILRNRLQVLEMLHPWRHLAAGHERN